MKLWIRTTLLVLIAAAFCAEAVPFSVVARTRGADVDTLVEEALGGRKLATTCDIAQGTCPDYALVWASGSFIDHFTPGALLHGGLKLRLSLCCNYTFKRVFAEGTSAPRFDEFVRTLVRHLPEPVQELASLLFDLRRLSASADLRAIELTTAPVPLQAAQRAVQSLVAHASKADTRETTTEDDEGDNIRPWNLLIANFVIDCKCPHTLRALPLLRAKHDSAPDGITLVGGGLSCYESDYEASVIDVTLPADALLPHAQVIWHVHPELDPNDVHTVRDAYGVKLFGVGESVKYKVSAVVSYGGAATTVSTWVGWSHQPHALIEVSASQLSETVARQHIITLDDRILLPYSTTFGRLRCNTTVCDDADRSLQALEAMFSCNYPHRIINASFVEVSGLFRSGGVVDIKCSVKDPIRACPPGGSRIQVNPVRSQLTGAAERVICSPNATLTANVVGLPSRLRVEDHVTAVWECRDPVKQHLVANGAGDSIVISVPAAGLVCAYIVTPKPELVEKYMLPWDPSRTSQPRALVKLSSSYAQFEETTVHPIHLTTKTVSLPITAPTSAGSWKLQHPKLAVSNEEVPKTTLLAKQLTEGFNTTIQWLNRVPPCIGHEFNIPVIVELAPPRETTLCEHQWYNDVCQQIASKYPSPDEQGEFFVDNSTGLVPPHNLTSLGANSVILCDAPDGSKVPVTWRVWNAAGNLTRTCVMQRCSKIPTPQMAPRMAQTIVMGTRMQVEVLPTFDQKRFFGTWTASSPGVKFDDPHAIHTNATNLPPGRTTIVFTLDAIGESGRPEDFCPTRSILVHVVSEAALCPTAPLHTCTGTVVSPFFQMAPKADRIKQPGAVAQPSDFVIVCDHPDVVAKVDNETGELRATGVPVGANVSCTVTAAYSEFSEQHCRLFLEHVHRSPMPVLSLEPFWVGGGVVPATASVRIAHGRRPGLVHWTIESRNLNEVSRDVQRKLTTELSTSADVEANEGWASYETTVDIDVEGESKVTVTATYEDELCGRESVTATLQSVLARVSVDNITTCAHTAGLEGRQVKALTTTIKSQWTILKEDTTEPLIKRKSLPWLMPTPSVEHPDQPFTSVNFLHWGTYIIEYALFLEHRPEVRHSVNVTVHALSRNIPPHNATIFTTQSKLEVFVAPEATMMSLVSAPGFHPAQPPTALRLDTTGRYLLARLYRGFYRLNYHPRPVMGREGEVCPVVRRVPMHHTTIRRVALRVIAQWDRSLSECDLIRGEASMTLRLMMAYPNGSYAPAPLGLEFVPEGALLRRVLSSQNPGLWWLSDAVNWTVTPLIGNVDLHPIDPRHNLHVLPAEAPSIPNANATSRYQTVRIHLKTSRFFSSEELKTPSFQNLRFPAAAINGLAESADVAARMNVFVRVVQLNGTALYVLESSSTSEHRFTDEDVANGRLITELAMRKVVVASSGNASAAETGTAAVSGFITALHPMCNAATLAQWIVGFPAPLRDAQIAKCEVNADLASITVFVKPNATFVIARTFEVRLIVPKRAICGLDVEVPTARRAAPTYTANDVVDFGLLIVVKEPVRVEQTRSSALQCILASEVPIIAGSITGGYVMDPWYEESKANATSSPALSVVRTWHNMTVTRTDGFHVLADVNSGPSSVAACIQTLKPSISFVSRRRFKVKVNPCPNLQLPQTTLPRVGLNFRLEAALQDGVGMRPLDVHFEIVGSFARLRALINDSASGSLVPMDTLDEVTLKTGRVVFEVTLEGDAWHPAVGSLTTQSHNTLVARGFGIEEDGEDLKTVERRQRQEWVKHTETHGLLRYVDDYLLPSHVTRLNDTVIYISVPGCTTRACHKIAFSNDDDPVHYFVPGIATACPGCLRANPPVVVAPSLGPIVIEALVDGKWTRMQRDATFSKLPEHIVLVSEGASWSPLAASYVTMQAVNIANEERAVYAATQATEKRLSMSLVTDSSAAATAKNATGKAKGITREVLMLRSILQPSAFQLVQESALVSGPLIYQLPLALAPPLPEGVLPLRVGLAASHGYLAFFAADSVGAALTGRNYFAPSYGVSRSLGVACFAMLLMTPARSILSWLVFAVGWGCIAASRRMSLVTLELFAVHLLLIYLAP